MKKRKKRERKSANFSIEELAQLLSSSPEMLQPYETLMSSLHLLNSTRSLKTILVTSTQPEEGKTTVTINLALAAMLAGKKTLIVDADLRKPRLHQILKLENEIGLVDVLAGRHGVQDVIQAVKVRNEGSENRQTLFVITSGKVYPTSFNSLGSSNLQAALNSLKSAYEIVLLDSPPTLSVSDALLLAPLVDGVILALGTGLVTGKNAKTAKERLEQAGGHILGVVMNRFDEELHGPGFHPYHKYYHSKAT